MPNRRSARSALLWEHGKALTLSDEMMTMANPAVSGASPDAASRSALKVTTLLIIVTLTLSSCGPSTPKQHVKTNGALKQHARDEVPYTVNWGACIVSVTPVVGDAKYIFEFPNTLKKLQFVNPYESPKDVFMAIKAFPWSISAA